MLKLTSPLMKLETGQPGLPHDGSAQKGGIGRIAELWSRSPLLFVWARLKMPAGRVGRSLALLGEAGQGYFLLFGASSG